MPRKSDLYDAKDRVHLDKRIYKPIADGNIRMRWPPRVTW